MIFLNWLLALGALAFTVPLAIHLLFRNRFEIVDWGAMRFLESVIRINRRRMKLRNLLLLLVRCAIPILLAFCLARPVLTGWKALPGNEPISMVLALDTSYSLAAKVDPSANRFDRLIATAQEIVSTLPRGSDVTLITSASSRSGDNENDDASRGDPQSTLNDLRSLRIGGNALSLERLLSEALRKVTTAPTERRQVVLLTDNAASDFSDAELDALNTIGERRSAIVPTPVIAWIDSWQVAPDTLRNRRVTKLEPIQTSSVPGQSVTWNVEARMDGELPTTSSMEILLDGEISETKVIAFRSGLATATFETVFDNAGRHAVEVVFPGDDDFSADDRKRADFMVYPPLNVWLVDGNPSDKPLQSDTDFLGIALSPFSLAGEKAVDLFSTETIGVRQLSSRKTELPKIVVLADVGPMQSSDLKWLQNFVEIEGGTLVFFAGPATDADRWDKQLVAIDGTPLLPMKWGAIKSSAEAGAKIDESRLTYPPLAAFSKDAKGTLASVEVVSYRSLVARDKTIAGDNPSKSADANVILWLENGDPLMAVGDVGKGRVLQIATTANDRWTSFPRRLPFVPFVQRLFLHLATGSSLVSTPFAGEPISFSLPELTAEDEQNKPDKKEKAASPSAQAGSSAQANSSEHDWMVTTPTGDTLTVKPAENRLIFTDTVSAGTYRFESNDGRFAFAAVNVPEQDLRIADAVDSVRSDAAKRMGATRYESVSAYQNDDSTRRFGRGIWRYMLLALLAAMIFEPILQQRGAKVTS